jgi:hypothetical protein
LLAATDVTVGDIDIGGGVSITATAGSVLDADALVAGANDADLDISAARLRLSAGAGLGESVDHLETAVGTLSARAGGGGIYLLEADDLSVDDVAVSVNRLVSDASTSSASDATQSDVRTTGGNGSIVLRTTTGAITLGNGTAPGSASTPADSVVVSSHGTGSVLIEAMAGVMTVNADVVSGELLTLVAQGNLVSGTGARLLAADDLYVQSVSGSVDLGGSAATSAGNALVRAGTSVSVETVAALEGHARLVADSGSVSGKAAAIDVRASELSVLASAGIGTRTAPLLIAVLDAALSAGAGGIYVQHSDLDAARSLTGLGIVSLSNVAFERFSASGASSEVTVSQAGLATTQGGDLNLTVASDLLLASAVAVAGSGSFEAAGDLLVSSGSNVTAAGRLALKADLVSIASTVQSTGQQLGVQAVSALGLGTSGRLQSGPDSGLAVAVTGGQLNLSAGGVLSAGSGGLSLSVSGNANLLGQSLSAGSVDMVAARLLMNSGSDSARVEGSISAAGDVRLQSAADVALGSIVAAGRNVALVAGSSITDGEAALDITASGLYLQSGTAGGIAASADRLETSVDRLALSVGSLGAHLQESNSVAVDTVPVQVARLAPDGSSSVVGGGWQDLTGLNNGSISLLAGGTITLKDGTDVAGPPAQDNTDGAAVRLSGAGALRLEASSLVVLSDVLSATGALTLDAQTADLAMAPEARITSTGGNVNLKAAGDVTLGQVSGQGVSVESVGGSILKAQGSDRNLTAAQLQLRTGQTGGVGTVAAPLDSQITSLDANLGSGGLNLRQATALNASSLVSGGPVALSGGGPATIAGDFSAPSSQAFAAPVTVRSANVDVDAPLTGQRIDIQSPSSGLLPMVIGTPKAGVTPVPGSSAGAPVAIFLDQAEVSNLRFDDVVLGSSLAGQQIWVHTASDNPADKVSFEGRLTLNASQGVTRFSGLVEGKGMTLNGRGQTTYFQGVDMRQTGDVTINDALDVTASSILELDDDSGDRVLTVNGNITVRAGQTLQLLADQIVFNPYPGAASARIVVEAGATLVLGADTITRNAVSFDSAGGHLVLRGSPSATAVTSGGLMQPDFVPDALHVDEVVDWTGWALGWLNADTDADGGLLTLTLGDEKADTVVLSPDAWNGLEQGAIILRGAHVHLGQAGAADWTFNRDAVVRASAGDVHLHVDVQAQGDLTLASNAGQVQMDAGVRIEGAGAGAVIAATGIDVAQIQADQRIDLYSSAGQITAVAALGSGQAHLQAPSLSFHGYGLSMPLADQVQLVVDAQALQVSAPTGVASRGVLADGSLYYRLVDQQGSYHQLRILGDAPQRVMEARAELVSRADQAAQGVSLSLLRVEPVSVAAWSASLDLFRSDNQSATSRYLAEPAQAAASSFAFMSLQAPSLDDELEGIDYGYDGNSLNGGLVLSSEGDLLRSTGQAVAPGVWSTEVGGL